MALNHTCHELVEDVDECETRDEDLTEPCNIHLKSTRQELLHAEEDIHSAIEHCEAHPHDNLNVMETLKSTGLEGDEMIDEEFEEELDDDL